MNKTKIFTRKFLILLKAQIHQDLQSRFDFCSRYLWILFAFLTYHFMFKEVLSRKAIDLGEYRIDFPLFLISGFALIRFIPFALRIFQDSLANLKKNGLAEWVLVTPTSLWELLAAHALWKAFVATTEVLAAIIFARFMIGTPIRPFFQVSILIAALLMVMAYAGIGMAISGFALMVKRGLFLFPVLTQASIAFGGVFFPTKLFPREIAFLAGILPVTNTLKIIRAALVKPTFAWQMPLALALIATTLTSLLLGLVLLRAGIAWARRNGKL